MLPLRRRLRDSQIVNITNFVVVSSVGMKRVWRTDLFHKSCIDNPRSVILSNSRVLNDLHIQEWVQKLNSSSKGKSYNCFKEDLSFENYLLNLDKTLRQYAYSNILKISPPTNWKFSDKNSDIFIFLLKTLFLSRNKKNNVYPCKPQFYYIKVGFKGVKII